MRYLAPPRRRRGQELETDEARQADGDRETIRVLDASMVLAVIAFVVLGIYFASALAA